MFRRWTRPTTVLAAIAAAGVMVAAALPLAAAQDAMDAARRITVPGLPRPPEGAPPLHKLTFPHSPRIGGVAFAPDGGVLYVQTYPEVINTWEVLVWLWPELLGAVTVTIAVVAALLLLRVLRRPQRRGEPHCRRCNYNLSGLAPPSPPSPPSPASSDASSPAPAKSKVRPPCPECGADLSRHPPRTGRRTRRRLAPILIPALAVVLAYTAMWAVRLPRQGRVSAWFDWPSGWLTDKAASGRMAWLKPLISQRERIVAVDPAMGEVLRTVARRATPTLFPLTLSPDGEWLLLSAGPVALERVSTRDGSVGGMVRIAGEDSYKRFGGRDIAGFTPDGASAYVVHLDAAKGKTCIVRWNLRTDEVTPVFETDAFTAPTGRARTDARRVTLIPGEPPMFAVAPSFGESYHTGGYTVWVHDGATGEVVREIPVSGPHMSLSFPRISPDGERLFISAMSRGIQGFDLWTGESLGHVRPGSLHDTGQQELLLSRDGDLLFFPIHPAAILVRSLPERRWIARLSTAGLIGVEPVVSDDARWLAVVGFQPGSAAGPAGKYLHELIIHDLGALKKDRPPGGP